MENTNEFIKQLRCTIANWNNDAMRCENQGDTERAAQIRQWVGEAEGIVALHDRFFDLNRPRALHETR